MALYQYKCSKCSREIEEIRKIAERDKTKECVACLGDLKRLQSSSSFQLKGQGWYQTDFKNK